MTRFNKILVSAFIVITFLTMIRIHVPLKHRFFSTIYEPVDAYLSFFSTYQDWYMFAPNPSRSSYKITAEVEFTDGSREPWAFPDPSKLSVREKYQFGEKYRKLVGEALRRNDHSFMWPDVAKFVLRKVGEEHFDKIPRRVHLIRHWEDVPLLSEAFRPHRSGFGPMESHLFYTHEVLP